MIKLLDIFISDTFASLILSFLAPATSCPLRQVEFDSEFQQSCVVACRTLCSIAAVNKAFAAANSIKAARAVLHPYAIVALFCCKFTPRSSPAACTLYDKALRNSHPPSLHFDGTTYAALCTIGQHAATVVSHYPSLRTYLVCYACFAFITSCPIPSRDLNIPIDCSKFPHLTCHECGRKGDLYITRFHSYADKVEYVRMLKKNTTLWHQYKYFLALSSRRGFRGTFKTWEHLHGILHQQVGYMCRDDDYNIEAAVAAAFVSLHAHKPYQAQRRQYKRSPRCSLLDLQRTQLFNEQLDSFFLSTTDSSSHA